MKNKFFNVKLVYEHASQRISFHLKNVKISTFYFAKKFIQNTHEMTWREKILNLAHE